MIETMKAIGLFEAKTKLSALCEKVFSSGESFCITRRGTAVAVLSPPAELLAKPSVWDRRTQLERQNGAFDEDFELPPRKLSKAQLANPLD